MKPLTLIASICVVLGIYLLGRKKRIGWIFQFIGSVLSIVHFWFIAYDPSVTILNAVLACLASWSWLRWGSDEPLMLRFNRWRGAHHYIGGICRGCGVWITAEATLIGKNSECEWEITAEQWTQIDGS